MRNDEKNKCMLLNSSLQKLIQPFWRHLDFFHWEIYGNTVEWHEISLALKVYTERFQDGG
jgi:hypothetical protein